jgi:hypothetical protein
MLFFITLLLTRLHNYHGLTESGQLRDLGFAKLTNPPGAPDTGRVKESLSCVDRSEKPDADSSFEQVK